jgi:DNA-directed RNA polymerase subunit RPC12/RpoP
MPDYAWPAIIAGIILLGLAWHFYIYKRYHYICPKCAASFKPPTFIRSLTAVNAAQYRKMKCPRCNYVTYMEALKDKTNRKEG